MISIQRSRDPEIKAKGNPDMTLRSASVALLAIASFATHAATFCVQNAASLHYALEQAVSNGQDDTIKIVAGTLPVDDSIDLLFSSSQDYDLSILGGYDATCAALAGPDAKSRLVGTGNQPLGYLSMYGTSTGHILLQRLVWQNGAASTSQAAVEIYTSGSLQIEQSAFLDLHGGANRPHAIEIRVAGNFNLLNNVFARNISGEASGTSVIYLNSFTGETAHVTGNTFTDNHGVNGVTSTLQIEGTRIWSIANTILYGNGTIYSLKLPPSAELRNNDIDYYAGTPAYVSGNLSVDPQFVGGDDYHLASGSVLVNAGFNAADGGVGPYDYDGNPRVVSGYIDIGAYEFQDHLFVDGFDGATP
jgi:hypothetical protein